MDVIIKSLIDPSWWFTGIFFVLVAYALPPCFRRIKGWLRALLRSRQAIGRRKVKNMRLNADLLTYTMGRANVYYMLFLALGFGYLFFISFISSLQGGKIQISLAVVLSTPVFIFELAWINSDTFVKEVIAARRKFFHRSRREIPSVR